MRSSSRSNIAPRAIFPLTRTKPAPILQLHPTLAKRHGISLGQLVTLESRRGRAEFRAEVTADIRPDTLYAPFHWGEQECANSLIGAFLDPVSRMPEFKLAAVRIVTVQPLLIASR